MNYNILKLVCWSIFCTPSMSVVSSAIFRCYWDGTFDPKTTYYNCNRYNLPQAEKGCKVKSNEACEEFGQRLCATDLYNYKCFINTVYLTKKLKK